MRLCLGKINFVIMGIAALMILVGFIMMASDPTTPDHFNSEVFAPMHWEYAGTVCFLGYILMIVGICVKSKNPARAEEKDNGISEK